MTDSSAAERHWSQSTAAAILLDNAPNERAEDTL
jgi:hypothetical protein